MVIICVVWVHIISYHINLLLLFVYFCCEFEYFVLFRSFVCLKLVVLLLVWWFVRWFSRSKMNCFVSLLKMWMAYDFNLEIYLSSCNFRRWLFGRVRIDFYDDLTSWHRMSLCSVCCTIHRNLCVFIFRICRVYSQKKEYIEFWLLLLLLFCVLFRIVLIRVIFDSKCAIFIDWLCQLLTKLKHMAAA